MAIPSEGSFLSVSEIWSKCEIKMCMYQYLIYIKTEFEYVKIYLTLKLINAPSLWPFSDTES